MDMGSGDAEEIDWPTVVFHPAFMAGLDRMAAKRFVQPALAEEATTAILDGLSEQSWQRLKSFTGKSSPSTFAYTVAGRLMEDFARRKFGRPRPPLWLQEQGQAWVRLWHMLCLERQWPETIQQKLAADFQDGFIAEAIRTIKQKIPRCGEPGFAECCMTELGLEQLPDDQGTALETGLRQTQRANALTLLGQLLTPAAATQLSCPSNAMEALESLDASLALSEDDRLLLSLSYEDGLSSRKVAEMLDTSPASVQRRLQAIRDRLRVALQAMGVDDIEGEAAFGD